jgi:hypothetical protein
MAFDFKSNIDKYSGYNPNNLASNTFSGLNFNYPLSAGEMNTLDYSLPYTVDTSNVWDNFVNNLNDYEKRQQILGNIGRLGTGLATGLAAMQAQSKPDYMFTSNWAGNGLARIGTIDNQKNKANNLNRVFGSGDYINSLFGKNLSSSKFNKDLNNWAWADAKREQYGW